MLLLAEHRDTESLFSYFFHVLKPEANFKLQTSNFL